MKKTWLLLVFCTVCAVALVGCSSNADTMPSASPSASVTPTTTATATNTAAPTPSTTPDTTMGAMTIEDSKRVAAQIDEEVEKLSEISEASVVVSGNMALIGVTFDGSYQAGVTDRLTEMIDARVATVDKSVTAVHVTDDETARKEIEDLASKVENGGITFNELQTKMLELSNTISGASSTTEPATTSGTSASTRTR